MIYTFNQTKDIYNRVFLGQTTSFWDGRPIYDRLPSANQQYNKHQNQFNDEGKVLLRTIPNATTFGEGTLQVEVVDRYLIKINQGAITWSDDETFIRELFIGVSSNEDRLWEPSTTYYKGEVLYDSEGTTYTVQRDYTSEVLITFDLQNGHIFQGSLGAGEQYVWLELFKYRPHAYLRTDIPSELSDISDAVASRSSILHPPRFALDPNLSKRWAPPNSLNSNDTYTITFNGFVELDDFRLYSNFTNGPTASLSYRSGTTGGFIPIALGVVQDSNGVWDFPVDFFDQVKELQITFNGANSLDIRRVEVIGNWLQYGLSSIRNQFVGFRASPTYDMDDPTVLGSCVLAQVVVDGNGEVSQINDTRAMTYDRNEVVADWLTVYWDELLIESRKKIDNYLTYQLNPETAGDYFYETVVKDITQIDENTLEFTETDNIITPFGVLE